MVGQKKFTLADGCQIVVPGKDDAQLKDLELGQKYKFTYEAVNGVNIAERIAPTKEATAAQTASSHGRSGLTGRGESRAHHTPCARHQATHRMSLHNRVCGCHKRVPALYSKP